MYDHLKTGTHALIWRHCDTRSTLRIVEIMAIDRDLREFKGWYRCHGGAVAAGQYVHERPLLQARLIPEWVEDSSGSVIYKPNEAMKKKCTKITDDFDMTDTEIISYGFPLQSGGKVPENIIGKADAWLRKQVAVEPRAVLALSHPSERERAAANRMR
jgi:hypothetical protein